MSLPPPLTPLERALLTAVVELGDEAYGVPIRQRAEILRGRGMLSIGSVYVTLNRLEEEGFVRSFDVNGDYPERGGRARRYWRPVGDLSAVLAEEETTQ